MVIRRQRGGSRRTVCAVVAGGRQARRQVAWWWQRGRQVRYVERARQEREETHIWQVSMARYIYATRRIWQRKCERHEEA